MVSMPSTAAFPPPSHAMMSEKQSQMMSPMNRNRLPTYQLHVTPAMEVHDLVVLIANDLTSSV